MTQDTICALATPPGGAIAVVRVSGPEAVSITDSIFSKSIKDVEGYTLHFGQIMDMDGKELDEVLVSVFRAPHSYTGEDSAEISCHGSSYIVQSLLESLIWGGARQAEPWASLPAAQLHASLSPIITSPSTATFAASLPHR